MSESGRVFNPSQPFNIRTDRISPAQLDSRLVDTTAQTAMMHFSGDMPGTSFIQPTLHPVALEGTSGRLIINPRRGRVQRRLELTDYPALFGLIFVADRLLLINGGT